MSVTHYPPFTWSLTSRRRLVLILACTFLAECLTALYFCHQAQGATKYGGRSYSHTYSAGSGTLRFNSSGSLIGRTSYMGNSTFKYDRNGNIYSRKLKVR